MVSAAKKKHFENFYPFSDCSEYIVSKQSSGPATIYVGKNLLPARTFCTDEGWTVIQSRGPFNNPKDYFSRNWTEYHKGFGEPGNLDQCC